MFKGSLYICSLFHLSNHNRFMKTFRTLVSLAIFCALCFSVAPVKASIAVSEETAKEMLSQKVSAQQTESPTFAQEMNKRMAKKMAKIEKKISKKLAKGNAIDFNDPINKWMWFWLLGWAAGFVLYSMGWFIAAPFWYLGYLCMLAGTACLVVWLLKKSGNM
jgi:hypothetical protein